MKEVRRVVDITWTGYTVFRRLTVVSEEVLVGQQVRAGDMRWRYKI